MAAAAMWKGLSDASAYLGSLFHTGNPKEMADALLEQCQLTLLSDEETNKIKGLRRKLFEGMRNNDAMKVAAVVDEYGKRVATFCQSVAQYRQVFELNEAVKKKIEKKQEKLDHMQSVVKAVRAGADIVTIAGSISTAVAIFFGFFSSVAAAPVVITVVSAVCLAKLSQKVSSVLSSALNQEKTDEASPSAAASAAAQSSDEAQDWHKDITRLMNDESILPGNREICERLRDLTVQLGKIHSAVQKTLNELTLELTGNRQKKVELEAAIKEFRQNTEYSAIFSKLKEEVSKLPSEALETVTKTVGDVRAVVGGADKKDDKKEDKKDG